jgi:hypothetical protein
LLRPYAVTGRGGSSPSGRPWAQPTGGQGRNQYKTPGTSGRRRLEQVRRPLAVGAEEFGLVPGGDHAGHVIDDILAVSRCAERRQVEEVAVHQADPRALVAPGAGRRPYERGDLVAALEQGIDQVAADEAGAARHQRFHRGRS